MKFKGIALPLISSLIFFACNRGVEPNHELSIMSSDSTITQEINDPSINKYGIPADSFEIIQGKIRPNTFISDILLKAGVPMQDIDQALNNSRDVFDVRKVLPGRNYALLYDKQNPGRAKYMIYEHEPATDYVFSFNDSLNITAFRKKVNTVVQYATGTITSSLWEAIIDQDLNPEIAVNMADIFAWTVDFFGLEKGDRFKIVYEENFIEGQSLGVKKILTAQFISSGKTYTAIPFIQDGKESFFDLDGNSLKKAFLKAPLKFSRISSRYTTSRLHPILKIRRPHLGVDYAAPTGTPVYAVGDGKVLSVTYDGASGRMIKIKHNSSYMTAYMHLSRFERGITPGSMVRQGQIIGYVGSTGLATGPHLDFRFYNNGTPVDPLKVIAPPAEPVTDANREKFNMIKEVNLSLLNTL
jgi:murein DD-endopeptidase MepM/ murein hydrolase activator NlpD